MNNPHYQPSSIPTIISKTLRGPENHKPPHFALYFGAFRLTERNAFITFLKYLLVAYCRCSEQSWGSGLGGTGPQNAGQRAQRSSGVVKASRQKGWRVLYGCLKEAVLGTRCLCPPTQAQGFAEPLEYDHVWSTITSSERWEPRLPLSDCSATW